MKKFSKIIENKTYNEELGYSKDITGYLSGAYQLWTDAEGLPQLSADEHDMDKLNHEQKKFILAFIEIWEIANEFEKIYIEPHFIASLKAKKYNL